MGTISWGEIQPISSRGSGSGGSNLFMRLGAGKHTVRLVHQPVRFYVAWIKGKKYIVPPDMVSRLESLGVEPRLTYASNCFDRADTAEGITRLKILEKGTSVFSHFQNYFNEVKDTKTGESVDPGGNSGPDWRVVVNVPPGADGVRRTKYDVIPLAPTPFSKEEIKLLARGKPENKEQYKDAPLGEKGLIDLNAIYDEEKARQKLEPLLRGEAGLETATESVSDIVSSPKQEDSKEETFASSSSEDDPDIESLMKDLW